MDHDLSSGTALRRCALAEVIVEEVEMDGQLDLSSHRHDTGQLCFVLEGSYDEATGGRPRRLTPGMVLLRWPGEPHENHFGEPVTVLLVSYEPARFRHYVRASDSSRDLHASEILRDLRDEVMRELDDENETSRHALESLSLLLLSDSSRSTLGVESAQPWFLDALAVVDRDYCSRLTLAGLASKIGIHRVTLSAAFRMHLNVSFSEHLRNRRVAEARRLLRSTRCPIAEISHRLGFYDQAHFTNDFRRVAGRTPGLYRRIHGSSRQT